MAKQEMYGPPVSAPRDAIVLFQHWNYTVNGDGTRKAAPQLKRTNTYSSCIERPCMRLFFALCDHKGYTSLKVDATNAYANSLPPHQPTFVAIDDQYAGWYLARHGIVVPRDMVLPVQHALQGHPESGALWEKFVNSVIARHGFESTTHERSLYCGVYKGHQMLMCREVDDLAIGCADIGAVQDLVRVICSEDGIDLRDEGILESFIGVDIKHASLTTLINCLCTSVGRPPDHTRLMKSPSSLLPFQRRSKCSTITPVRLVTELPNIVIWKRLVGFRIEVSWAR